MKTFHTFKGYANGQMHRIRQKNPETEERKSMVKKFGYDIKMGYHVLRLIDQMEQILTIGDIDLMRNKEEHKLMRFGEWGDLNRFEKEFQKRMDNINDLSTKCNLSNFPQEGSLKRLLSSILEEHYNEDTSQPTTEFISAKEVYEKIDLMQQTLSKLISS